MMCYLVMDNMIEWIYLPWSMWSAALLGVCGIAMLAQIVMGGRRTK